MADEQSSIDPSSAGQEPPFVSPATSDPSSSDAAPRGGANDSTSGTGEEGGSASAVPNSPSPSASGPRRIPIRLHFNASGEGRGFTISRSSGGTININPSGTATAGPVPVPVMRVNNNSTTTNTTNNNNQQQQRAPTPIRINRVPGAPTPIRVNRIPAHNNLYTAGSSSSQTNNNNNNNSNNAGRQAPMMGPGGPMLPPLEPQQVPNQTSSEESGNDAPSEAEVTEKDMKKFECSICFEYMDCPVGCGAGGSCQTRFCHSCLQRVLRQEINNRDPSLQLSSTTSSEQQQPPNAAKCPHCRSYFTQQSMVMDRELAKQISACTDTVTCPFKGCGTELRIGLLKSHEAQCSYVRMRCRYAKWGCEWVGKKKDLGDHETNECEFRCGLGKLVERFRQSDAQKGGLLQQHHMQIGATSQMLTLQSRQMMMMRGRNAGNVFDVMRLAYGASLFPGRFSAMREMWSGMINSPGRFMVCNVLLMLPSLVLMLRVSLQGFKLLSNAGITQLFKLLSSPESITASAMDDWWYLLDTLILSLIVSVCGILCTACFFVDPKSPTDWTIYNVKNIIPGHPILRDLAAICMAMAHLGAIEFWGAHPGIMLWHFTTIVTVFLASFVSHIIEKNESTVSDATMMRTSRAWPVVMFGLRYGFLFAMFGVSASLYAFVSIQLLKTFAKKKLKWSFDLTVEESECVTSKINIAILIVIAPFIAPFEYDLEFSCEDMLLDFALATIVLAYVNTLIFLLVKAGRKLGESNFHVGTKMFMEAHRASGAFVPNVQPTPVGCAVFGVCSFLLLCIAIA